MPGPHLFLCTDLDRTALPNGPQPESPRARSLFARLASRDGVTLAYVTGRHRKLVERAIANYGLPQPAFAITDVGTKIHAREDGVWHLWPDWEDEIDRDWAGYDHAGISQLFRDLKPLRLQELAEKVKPLLEDRQLEMGHARALLGISSPTQQYDAARQVVKKGLSVRETERLVRRMLAGPGKKPAKPAASKDADIRRLEIEVSEKLGAKVDLQHGAKGAGKLVISYNNLDELDGILKHIK